MSRIPKVEESKYNKDSKFAWVDSQWEKLMSQNQELKNTNEQLRKDLETCTKHYSKLYDEHKNLKKYFNVDYDDKDKNQLELC